jgi:hypothetical protein
MLCWSVSLPMVLLDLLLVGKKPHRFRCGFVIFFVENLAAQSQTLN